ncbi:MAG: N-acetylglucosamine-6-phosphate deacetylase [Actinomycetia bacterium]|nr:N-acetylglucosamine-6-phosphate deacetylase [Candidatus Omnitrophota bacterium]MCG2791484.1 N-acetylglucosamine-6-phosphate deacetylase [Actinomycetes bacterium]
MKEQKIILGSKIITPFKIIENGIIIISNGAIEYIGEEEQRGLASYDSVYKGEYIVPGFIDIHCHGGNGYDTMDSTYEALMEISKFKAKNGCTGFLATTVTSSIKDTVKALNNIREYSKQSPEGGAEILGVHLEGPFINAMQKGAQREDLILPLSVEVMEKFIKESGGLIKIVTYAPELDTDFKFTSFLNDREIIPSVGHSFADYETIISAIRFGLKSSSHIFNQMKGVHHREPGTVGAILTEKNLFAEIIADCVHVHPAIVNLLVTAKGVDKIILITDAMKAAGLQDGTYDLGGLKVIVKNSEARLESGNLAGSTLIMSKAVKNMIEKMSINIEKSVRMASLNPAQLLGLDKDRGSLTAGKRADIVVLDGNFNVVYTIKKGRVIYSKDYGN